MKPRNLAIALLTLLIVLSAVGCSPASTPQPQSSPVATTATPAPDVITAQGRLEPFTYTKLSLATDGTVSELQVKVGDVVHPGQVIALLQNDHALTLEQAQAAASTQLASAYDAVRLAQNKLDDFDIPSQFSGMPVVDAARLALEQLNAARAAFEPYKDQALTKVFQSSKPWRPALAPQVVVETGQYSGEAREYKKQLDNAWINYRRVVQWLELQSALESAQVQLAQAQKDYDSLQDVSLAEDTAGARAALANAELRSPFAGTITNLDLKVGEFAPSGQPVVTVADFSNWVVKTTDLTEMDVVNIKEGQPVTLTLDAIPGKTFNGYVLSIGQNYAEQQGDVVYEVSVLLTDKHPAMRWGMTAQVRFAS